MRGTVERIEENLDDLRQEIDRLDDALLGLLVRRIDIGRRVARAKGPDAVATLRPGREAQVVRGRLAASHEPVPDATLYRIWREILTANMSMQAPVEAAVLDDGSGETRRLAAAYCGAAMTISRAENADAALDAVAARRVTVAILPVPSMDADTDTPMGWWRRWLDMDASPMKPRVVSRLPFLPAPGQGAEAGASALILAAMEPEPTDDDRSLFLIQDRPESAWHLVEEAGFHTSPAGATGGEIWHRLGAYPTPWPAQ